MEKSILTLGIETSCDETCAAVVVNGREVRSNVVASQINIHSLYGGVVPEIASRNHIKVIDVVTKQALTQAGVTIDQIDNIGVTYGAGLVGALLVGVTYAKALSQAAKKPLYAVNHIEGHIAANYITDKNLCPPFICLIASGGHTSIVKINGYNDIETICSTVDDAIGESFDKVARVLGLPYPGGPQIDKLSNNGKPSIKLPTVLLKDGNFSYSGLKTAVINYCHGIRQNGGEINPADVARSFTEAAIDGLIIRAKQILAEKKQNRLAIAGGVAANSYLREKLTELRKSGYEIFLPSLDLCGDNAAMIASRAYFQFKENLPTAADDLNAEPSIR
ncbi:MAG TPA: tRNA (adenosine(37)-N6)-threonylcarbamoyltransferase complex transferase subunit TsaD [Eubacteriales bacterium]|nr:tRNA (adenosine(37)-N6)-threonylcarbamoyltransferase complex transferase subunit TsaD [Eubacteriales bacterium]